MNKLFWELIRFLKIKAGKTIASFDSKANNNQSHLITILHNKYAIRPNIPILIMLIGISEPEAWSCKSQRIEGWYKMIKSRAIL